MKFPDLVKWNYRDVIETGIVALERGFAEPVFRILLDRGVTTFEVVVYDLKNDLYLGIIMEYTGEKQENPSYFHYYRTFIMPKDKFDKFVSRLLAIVSETAKEQDWFAAFCEYCKKLASEGTDDDSEGELEDGEA